MEKVLRIAAEKPSEKVNVKGMEDSNGDLLHVIVSQANYA